MNVSALSITEITKLILSIKASLDGVFGHSFRLFKVDIASDLLQLAKVSHVFDQLIVRAVEAGVDVDFVLVHLERLLKSGRGVPLLSFFVIYLEI